jgi:hypothetical protein
MALIFNMAFFWHLFLEALAFVRNFKMQNFLHFLEEKTQKKNKKFCCQKRKFKMAAKFKTTKTKFSYVIKKILGRLRTFGQFDYAFYRFWAEKKYIKYLEAPKLTMAAQFKMAPIFDYILVAILNLAAILNSVFWLTFFKNKI